ncbi:hypothetical protein WJX74_008687 [Apatococcus lobatus]|uniref:Uncharacterized protein n=1 Tax=Apatococcus lobatus TaxID=904363 RepID=A0AAW1S795_9CHLO
MNECVAMKFKNIFKSKRKASGKPGEAAVGDAAPSTSSAAAASAVEATSQVPGQAGFSASAAPGPSGRQQQPSSRLGADFEGFPITPGCLWLLHPQQPPLSKAPNGIDFLAFHGIPVWPGDRTAHWDTWTIPGEGNWLHKLAVTYGVNTNVFVAELQTCAFTWNSVANLRDIARLFAGQQYDPLSKPDTFGGPDRLLVPIATSLGGLVAKQWLVDMSAAANRAKGPAVKAERCRQLLAHIPGIVCLAVPHFGSAYAKPAAMVPTSSPFLDMMKPNTPELIALNKDFEATVLETYGIDILNIYETSLTMVGTKGFLLVPSQSACVPDPQISSRAESGPSQADHRETARPTPAVYDVITAFISARLPSSGTQPSASATLKEKRSTLSLMHSMATMHHEAARIQMHSEPTDCEDLLPQIAQRTSPSACATSNGSSVVSLLLMPSEVRSRNWAFELKEDAKRLLAPSNMPWQLDAYAANGRIRFTGQGLTVVETVIQEPNEVPEISEAHLLLQEGAEKEASIVVTGNLLERCKLWAHIAGQFTCLGAVQPHNSMEINIVHIPYETAISEQVIWLEACTAEGNWSPPAVVHLEREASCIGFVPGLNTVPVEARSACARRFHQFLSTSHSLDEEACLRLEDFAAAND